jgi:hypothetical protein
MGKYCQVEWQLDALQLKRLLIMKAQEQKPQRQRRESSAADGSVGAMDPSATAHRGSRPEDSSRTHAVDRYIAGKILALLGNPDIRLRLWDGTELPAATDASCPVLWFRDRGALYSTLRHPELNFGDLYSQGRIEFEGDFLELLERVFLGIQDAGAPGWLRSIALRMARRNKRNTQRRSAENIHHHYDIGNDFYRMWLDSEYMQYTCAYYPDPKISLQEAQVAKLHHVCRKLQLKPGDSVVEAGCGWGGLARFMATHYGVTVRAYNISREQVAYATELAQRQGLSGRVEYVLDAGPDHTRLPEDTGPRPDPQHRAEPAQAIELLDRAANFPRRLPPDPARGHGYIRVQRFIRTGRGKPEAALRADPRRLVEAL